MAESTPGAASDPPVRGDAMEAVQKLLDATREPAPEAVSQEPEKVPSTPKPAEKWDLVSVAEKLNADPTRLYEDLLVTVGDGNELTVSALKDLYKPVAEVEKARKAFTEDQTKWQTERDAATRELHALLNALDPRVLSPEFLSQAQRQTETERTKQAAKVLELIPEWKDPVSKAADWSDIKGIAKDYGFTEADVAAAEAGYSDARFLKVMRRLAKLEQQVKVPAVKVEAKKAMGTQPAREQSQAQRVGNLKGAVTRGQLSTVAAVEKLLGGAGSGAARSGNIRGHRSN